MKYLFFDIECASVFKDKAKICVFGYCLTDEQFNIIEKQDLLINPQGGFHLTDRKGQRGLVLPYKYEDFKKYPTFLDRKEQIYSLLQDKDTLVFGHAVQNDVKYLNLESRRFSLPSFDFAFGDTQFLYMNITGDFSKQLGLSAIADELGVEFAPHRAVDDAYATMKIAEAMCKAENTSLLGLLKKYGVTLGRLQNYEVERVDSVAFIKYRQERERLKEERERLRAEFHIFADKEKRKRAKTGKMLGKTVCFSHPTELCSVAKKLLSDAFSLGARVTFKAEECDIYIRYENETGLRLQSAITRGAKLFSPESFRAYLDD